jgi:hypothetical protein
MCWFSLAGRYLCQITVGLSVSGGEEEGGLVASTAKQGHLVQ